MNEVLVTQGLCKRYGSFMAVDNVGMTVREGDIYGFVGLNGAGKTTLIRLISGLIKKTEGSFRLFGTPDGESLSAERRKLRAMVESPSLYLNMSAEDNMRMQCAILEENGSCITELLRTVGLEGTGKILAKNFSLGMKQRLAIAMALVGSPAFMMLDEPTNGLDPEGIVEVRDLLKKLNKEKGITILISSHILTELGKIATTYGFIHHGKLIREISAKEIFDSCGKQLVVSGNDPHITMTTLRPEFQCFCLPDGRVSITIPDGEPNVSEIISRLAAAGVTVSGITTETDDLESYFIKLLGGVK